MRELSEHLREHLELCEIKIDEFAARHSLGRDMLYGLLNNRKPHLDNLFAICEVLKINPAPYVLTEGQRNYDVCVKMLEVARRRKNKISLWCEMLDIDPAQVQKLFAGYPISAEKVKDYILILEGKMVRPEGKYTCVICGAPKAKKRNSICGECRPAIKELVPLTADQVNACRRIKNNAIKSAGLR